MVSEKHSVCRDSQHLDSLTGDWKDWEVVSLWLLAFQHSRYRKSIKTRDGEVWVEIDADVSSCPAVRSSSCFDPYPSHIIHSLNLSSHIYRWSRWMIDGCISKSVQKSLVTGQREAWIEHRCGRMWGSHGKAGRDPRKRSPMSRMAKGQGDCTISPSLTTIS